MNLYDDPAGGGLFDVQAKAFHTIATLRTAAETTLPTDVDDITTEFHKTTGMPATYESVVTGPISALTAWQNNCTNFVQRLADFAESVLTEMVDDDSTAIDTDLTTCLEYVIAQMEAGDFYVAANAVSAVLAAGAGNSGDTTVAWSLADVEGYDLQNAVAETLTLTIGANPSATTPTIAVLGEASVDAWNWEWPKGSGTSGSITATNPESSQVTNGTFEAATITDTPDDWIIAVGVPGTDVVLTTPASQTVTIAGDPIGGGYLLLYTDRDGNTWATSTLAYDASASTVQAALQLLPGLEDVEVASTGTSPNYTHAITFTGVGGAVTELTSINQLTAGTTGPATITHATVYAGNAGDYRGVALSLVGDGATLIALYQPLSALKRATVYFCNLRIKRSGAATGSVVKVAVVQEIGGTALTDPAGNSNELTIAGDGVSDSAHESQWFSFRLGPSVKFPVYLRIAVTTAIPVSSTLFIDEVAIAAGRQLYDGGPYFAAFSGRDVAVEDDGWTLVVSNDHAGKWQDYYNRAFDMAGKGLLLPTTYTTTGPTLISDTGL